MREGIDTAPRAEARRLLVAQALSNCADGFDFIAVAALLAFHWQVGPLVFGALALAAGLPRCLIGRRAEACVAARDPVAVMRVTIWLRGVVALAMALAPGWPALLCLVALRGGVDCHFHPARDGAFALLAPFAAEATFCSSRRLDHAARIGGPGLAGAALLLLAPGHLFFLAAGLAVLAGLALGGLAALPGTAAHLDAPRPPLRAGLQEARADPARAAALMAGSLAAGALVLAEALLAPLLRDLGHGAPTLAFALAALGAGAALGAVWRRQGRVSVVWDMADGALGAAIALGGVAVLAGTGLAAGPVTLCAFAACAGLALAVCASSAADLADRDAGPALQRLDGLARTIAPLAVPVIGAGLAAGTGMTEAFLAVALGLGLAARRGLMADQARARLPAAPDTLPEDWQAAEGTADPTSLALAAE